MIIPKHPLRGLREQYLTSSLSYGLSTCVYLPKIRKILFVTEPIMYTDRPNRAIIGLLEIDTCASSSVVCEWRPTSSVTSAAPCNQGVIVCSQSGLVFVNFRTGEYKLLAGSSNKATASRVMGVAVHSDGSIWFTYMNPETESRSRIYCLDSTTDRLALVYSSYHYKPIRIAISPGGRRCYTACSVSGAIYMYDVTDERTLKNEQRVSYIPVSDISSMKVDRDGYLYIACGSVLKCWDKYGQLMDTFLMSETIKDFVFTEVGEIIVMFKSKWVKLEVDPDAFTLRRRDKNSYSHLKGRFSRL